MSHLVAIVGPTGVGKSRLALNLAQTFKGEIVSADSRQVYRHMNIGTAKPTPQEMSLVPHHLISIVNPDDDFSLAQYQQLANRAISDIHRRGKLALLVGGSGLYVWSIVEGWGIPQVPPDPEFRISLEEKATKDGREELYQELIQVDPVAAQRIDSHNVRRLVRALEVHRYTQMPFSQLQHKETPSFGILIVGLTTDRTDLYHIIDSRVDDMIKAGLVEEVKKLIETGYSLKLPAMSSIGYKQISMYLNGELTLASAVQDIKFETHRFVRQQYAWFRLKDRRIHWLDIQNNENTDVISAIVKFLKSE
ncbi:tRNA (adenosine(37)-N6)-dimethylallyltransferase MiaA [Chloroflexota bacterium]